MTFSTGVNDRSANRLLLFLIKTTAAVGTCNVFVSNYLDSMSGGQTNIITLLLQVFSYAVVCDFFLVLNSRTLLLHPFHQAVDKIYSLRTVLKPRSLWLGGFDIIN